MIHTILINNDNTITKRMNGAIMHRSSNVDSLRILVDPMYTDHLGDLNMSECSCVMEFTTPSRKYIPKVLTPSAELYKNKIEYLLPITLELTKDFGELEFKFIFNKLEINSEGSFKERSRKISSSSISIIPVEQWSEYIASDNLDSIAQMMLANQSIANQQKAYAEMILQTKIDNLEYDKDSNILTGYADGVPVDSVQLEDVSSGCLCENGVPVVDFSNIAPTPDDGNEVDNVVEF